MGDDVGKVAPHERLAAGEMHLQHAERGRLAQAPETRSRCRSSRAGPLQLGAGWSNRRSAADSDASAPPAAPAAGPAGIAHSSSTRLSTSSCSIATTSRGDLLARRVERLGEAVDDHVDRARTVDQPQDLDRLFVRQQQPLGRQHDPGLPPLVEAELDVRRESAAWRRPPACAIRSSRMVGRDEGARRDQAGFDIGEIKRVELRPQHIAFETQRIEHEVLLLRRIGVLL